MNGVPGAAKQLQVDHAPGMVCGMRGIPHLKLVGRVPAAPPAGARPRAI